MSLLCVSLVKSEYNEEQQRNIKKKKSHYQGVGLTDLDLEMVTACYHFTLFYIMFYITYMHFTLFHLALSTAQLSLS